MMVGCVRFRHVYRMAQQCCWYEHRKSGNWLIRSGEGLALKTNAPFKRTYHEDYHADSALHRLSRGYHRGLSLRQSRRLLRRLSRRLSRRLFRGLPRRVISQTITRVIKQAITKAIMRTITQTITKAIMRTITQATTRPINWNGNKMK